MGLLKPPTSLSKAGGWLHHLLGLIDAQAGTKIDEQVIRSDLSARAF